MEKRQLVWDEEATLGAQQTTGIFADEPKLSLDALLDDFEETVDDVSEVVEDIPEIKEENPASVSEETSEIPEEVIPVISESKGEISESLLDRMDGEIGEASTRAFLDSPLNTKRNVAVFRDGKFKIIGLAPITVIEATDIEVALLQSDHLLKNGTLTGKEKADALKFEQDNLETVKKLFGVETVAELNNMSQEEFGKYFRRELGEATKIMLENVMRETGISELPNAVYNELADMDSPTERDIFKAVIKHLK